MDYNWIISGVTFGAFALLCLIWKLRGSHGSDKRSYDEHDVEGQAFLDDYIKSELSNEEVGKLYERYIGYLHEADGYNVDYNGAINGFADMGRDLILKGSDEVCIVQTKCWSKSKLIQEKHIFQLYGSLAHFRLTSKRKYPLTKAIFYTTSNYSHAAKEVASVLGIELRTESLNRSYPMVKCNVSVNGEKIYHLPCDPYYDKVKIKPHKEECFVHTTREAIARGFRRARKYSGVA